MCRTFCSHSSAYKFLAPSAIALCSELYSELRVMLLGHAPNDTGLVRKWSCTMQRRLVDSEPVLGRNFLNSEATKFVFRRQVPDSAGQKLYFIRLLLFQLAVPLKLVFSASMPASAWIRSYCCSREASPFANNRTPKRRVARHTPWAQIRKSALARPLPGPASKGVLGAAQLVLYVVAARASADSPASTHQPTTR